MLTRAVPLRPVEGPNDLEVVRGLVDQLHEAIEGLGATGAAGDVGTAARRLLRERRLRAMHLPADLFADPAWDMLLELTVAEAQGVAVPVASLCAAAQVPPTTALRKLSLLVSRGLVSRQRDPHDGRRVFVYLTDRARAHMADYMRAAGLLAPVEVGDLRSPGNGHRKQAAQR